MTNDESNNERPTQRREPTTAELIEWQWSAEGWHARIEPGAARAFRRLLRRGDER